MEGLYFIVNCTSMTYANGYTETYTYDASGNKTATTVTPLDSDSIISAYTYDANGNITSITDAQGNVEYYEYDANGNLLKQTDKSGYVTSYTYNSYGDILTETNAEGVTTTYTYYSNGLLKSMSCSGVTVTYTYENGQVKTIVQTGTNYTQTYTYTYNGYGNLLTVAVGNRTLVTYTYALGGAGNVASMTYANGYTEAYTYDAQGNMLTVKENGTLTYSYRYDLAGNVLVANDHKLGRTDVYFQSVDGYSSIVVTYDNDGDVYTVSNADGTIRLPDGSLYVSMPEGYAYGEGDTDEMMRSLGTALTYLAPDAAEGTEETTVFSVTYTYADTKTEYVTTETFSGGSVYSYTYDKLGNLTSVTENGILKVTYTYDDLCQLVREDNAYENKSFTWTYDAGGNILSKKEYAYTTGTLGAVTDSITYTYGDGDWKDLLTNYNGTAITYDASGNPLNWRNASAMTWDGRRLSSMTLTDGTAMSFAYNADGLRTRKTVGDETVEYVWGNGELISEIRDNYMLNFYYENGEVIGFNYKTNSTSSNYYYGKDTLGVIRYLYDANGTVVTTYTYDAWGRSVGCVGTLASTIGAVNPIRYKSYYLDTETGFYYLQSRYYDPAVGRFINADDIEYIGESRSILSSNICIYCGNNAVNNSDSTGNASWRLVAIGVQLELSIGVLTYGFEIIFTFDKGIKAFFFSYKGGSFGGDMIDNILDVAKSATKSARNLKKLFSASWSLCIMAVFSTSAFNPKTYAGPFNCVYVLGWCPFVAGVSNKMFYSWYGSYSVVGYGFCSLGWDIGYSRTFYKDQTQKINKIYKSLLSCFNSINSVAKKYKRKK